MPLSLEHDTQGDVVDSERHGTRQAVLTLCQPTADVPEMLPHLLAFSGAVLNKAREDKVCSYKCP